MYKKKKIFILYEKYKSEFFGKLALSVYLRNKHGSEIQYIKIGFYKNLILELLSLKEKDRENVIIFFKDLWKSSEVLIDLFKFFGFKYYTLHEEEILFYSIHSPKILKNRLVDKFHFNKIDGFFCLGPKSKNIYQKNIYGGGASNILPTNNLKYYFLDFIKNDENKKNKKKFVLVANGESIFLRFKNFYFQNKNKQQATSKYIYENNYDTKIDSYHLYKSSKKFLKFIINLSKNNKNINFVFRIHPGEESYINKYKKIFKKIKNIRIDHNNLSFVSIKKSFLVICPPSTIALESHLMGKNFLIYYDNREFSQKYCFEKHFSTEIFKQNIFRSDSKFLKTTPKENTYNKFNFFFSPANQTCELISNKIFSSLNEQRNNVHPFFVKIINFFINKIILNIKKIKKSGDYSILGYRRFHKEFKYSVTRIFLSIFFYKSSDALDFVFKIYKYCIARNSDNTPPEWDMGLNDLIDEKDIKKNINIIKKKLKIKKINFKLSKNFVII